MKVYWLRRAINELQAERAYIARRNPKAAAEVADYLYQAALRLEAMPYNAPEGEIAGTRELVITRYRYSHILVYRINDDRIEILRMIHGRRNWRKRLRSSR